MYRLAPPSARAARTFAVALAVGAAVYPAWTQTPEEEAAESVESVPAVPERPADVAIPTFTYEPRLSIDGGDDALAEAVKSTSLLFSYVKEPLDSVSVLFARARADEQRIVRALNALGYFGARVDITIAGGRADDIRVEDALVLDPPDKITVDVAVRLGQQFTFGRMTVVPAPGSSAEVLAVLGANPTRLVEGAPARSVDVVAADVRIVLALREAGYPFAAVVGREAIADHATSKLEVTFKIDPGAPAAFGDVLVKGTADMDPVFLAELATFEPGDRFKASTLTDYRSELERLLVFDAVTIEEGRSLDAQGRLPVTVIVNERPQHVVGVSASWSTLEGAALGGYWGHRNLWGRAEQLRLEAQSSRLFSNGVKDYEYALTATLTKPAFPEKRDDLIMQLGAKRERPDAYERDAVYVDARVRRRFDRMLSGEAGINISQAHERDNIGERDRTAIVLPIGLVYDTRDNILDPTRGIRTSAGLQPVINLNRGSGFALRADGVVSTYYALSEDRTTVIAGRVAVGMSSAAELTDLPVDMRFYAGGGGSVRGYEYQALSPRNAVNQLIGGLSKIEGSVELRSWVWDDIGLAAFVDAGSAFSSNFPDFDDIGVGVGVGARYRTPVGPVRLDIAIPLDPPLDDSNFGIYVALGQAF